MSERWLRLYEGVVNDPKLQRLPAETFRGLINLWCIASANGGKLPPMGEIGFLLRMSDKDACQLILDLDEAGLLDTHEDYTCPHNWNVRQYKSDVSTERVKRHRERKAAVSGNVPPPLHETPPETEADTEKRKNSVGSDEPTEIASPDSAPCKKAVTYPQEYDELWNEYRAVCDAAKAEPGSKKNAFERWRRLSAEDRQRCFDGVMSYMLWRMDRAEKPGLFTAQPKHFERFISGRLWETYQAEAA